MDARDLACYIMKRYKKIKKEEISSFKLHATLYFCFAYWSAYIKKEKKNQYPKFLFSNDLFVLGNSIVVLDVKNMSNKINNNRAIFIDSEQKEYIDKLLDEILPVNDFNLMLILDQDKYVSNRRSFYWTHLENTEKLNYVKLSKEKIIKEYIKRYALV